MDYAALLALLMTAYEAYKAKKAAGGDDNPDAVIETIMPEVAKYFASLFKNDADGFFTALNALVLGLYHISGDALQFFIRLMVNMRAEKLQARYPWMSLPFLIFIKGYFNALEEATKGKDKPTANDVKAAADKVAAEAKKAAGDLKRKFDAAKEAVKSMHIPNSNPKPTGGPVPHSDPHAAPSGAASAAGGTGKSFEERFNGLVASASLILEKAVKAAKRAEDLAQNLANGAVCVTGLVIATLAITFCAVMLSDNPRLLVFVIVVSSLAWVMGPFAAFLVWRRKAREIEASAPKNPDDPHDEPGNGVLEVGGIVLANAFVWGISTIVVAALCAIGAYVHFAWGYVWTGLISIGIGFFAWILGDLFADGTKALVRAFVKDENEGPELKLKNRFARSFSMIGIIYCFAMILPVFNGVLNFTKYSWDVGIPGLFLALLSGFVNTRSGSPASVLPAEHVKVKWLAFSKEAYVTGLKMFMWAVVPTLALLLLNSFMPPQCPDKDGDPKTVDVCELPSYSERIVAFVKKDAVNSATSLGNGTVGLVSTTEGAAISSCSAEVNSLMKRIEKDDCKVALQESKDPEALRLCNEAVSCGALREDGSKKPVAVRKVGPGDAGFNWWYVGVPMAIALLLGLAWIGRKDPKEDKEEKKEAKKPAAH